MVQLTAMLEGMESRPLRQEQDVYLVTEEGGAYVCSRHFTSEDYIFGCSDSRLNPEAVPGLSSSEKRKSVYERSNKPQSLPSSAG